MAILVKWQLFSMGFLEESFAGHYKKIGYWPKCITLCIFLNVIYVQALSMLCAKSEKIFFVTEVLIRNLVSQRLKLGTSGLQGPCSADGAKTNYVRADPF